MPENRNEVISTFVAVPGSVCKLAAITGTSGATDSWTNCNEMYAERCQDQHQPPKPGYP